MKCTVQSGGHGFNPVFQLNLGYLQNCLDEVSREKFKKWQ